MKKVLPLALIITIITTATSPIYLSGSNNPNKRSRPEDFSQELNLQPTPQLRRITQQHQNLANSNSNNLNPQQNQGTNNNNLGANLNRFTSIHSLINYLMQTAPIPRLQTGAIYLQPQEHSNLVNFKEKANENEENVDSTKQSTTFYHMNFKGISKIIPKEKDLEDSQKLFAILMNVAHPETFTMTEKECRKKMLSDDQLVIDYSNATPSQNIQIWNTLWQELYDSEEDEDLADEQAAAQKITEYIQLLLPLSKTKYIAAKVLEKIKSTPISGALRAQILESTAAEWRHFIDFGNIQDQIKDILENSNQSKEKQLAIWHQISQKPDELTAEQKDHKLAAETLLLFNKRSAKQTRNILSHVLHLPVDTQVKLMFNYFHRIDHRNTKCRLIEVASIFSWIKTIIPQIQNTQTLQKLTRIALRFTISSFKFTKSNAPISFEKGKAALSAYVAQLIRHAQINQYWRSITETVSNLERSEELPLESFSKILLDKVKNIPCLTDTQFLKEIQTINTMASPILFRYGQNITDMYESRVPTNHLHISKLLEKLAQKDQTPDFSHNTVFYLFLNRIAQIQDPQKRAEMLAPLSLASLTNKMLLTKYFNIVNSLPLSAQADLIFTTRSMTNSEKLKENKTLYSQQITNLFFSIVKRFSDDDKDEVFTDQAYASILFARHLPINFNIDKINGGFISTTITFTSFLEEFIQPISNQSIQIKLLSDKEFITKYLAYQSPQDLETFFAYIEKFTEAEQAEIITAILEQIEGTWQSRLNLIFTKILEWLHKKNQETILKILTPSKRLIILLLKHHKIRTRPQTQPQQTNLFTNIIDPLFTASSSSIKLLQATFATQLIAISLNNELLSANINHLKQLGSSIAKIWQFFRRDEIFAEYLIQELTEQSTLIPQASPNIWLIAHKHFSILLSKLFYRKANGEINTLHISNTKKIIMLTKKIRNYYNLQFISEFVERALDTLPPKIKNKLTKQTRDDLKEFIQQTFDFILDNIQATLEKKEHTLSNSLFTLAGGNNTKIIPLPSKAHYWEALNEDKYAPLKGALNMILNEDIEYLFTLFKNAKTKQTSSNQKTFFDLEFVF